jgi:glycosyltransferase involved in cell wall biosynthesis
VLVEVTDTVAVPYTTGLQRVARALLRHLTDDGDGAGPTFRPVVWSDACDGYRDLTADEVTVLADPPERLPRTTRLSRRLPSGAAAAVRRLLAVPMARRARATFRDAARRRAERDRVGLCLPAPGRGDVLLDLEAAWNDPVPRTELLDRLGRAGTRSATLVADVLPVMHPEWFDRQLVADFDRFLDGHLAHSELFLCISERTRLDLLAVATARGVGRELDARVIPLGADLDPAGGATGTAVDTGLPVTVGRYLLMVGTIEPRKNQALALDLLDALARTHPDVSLVLVGKRGWKVDDLIRRIEHHPGRGGRLVWLEEVDDRRLRALYLDAFVCLAPARYEGLGVTVMEALGLGTPVIASDAGALPEAGGAAADYAGPDDLDAWVRLVTAQLDHPEVHRAARDRARAWRPPTWQDAARAVRDAVSDVFGEGYSTP